MTAKTAFIQNPHAGKTTLADNPLFFRDTVNRYSREVSTRVEQAFLQNQDPVAVAKVLLAQVDAEFEIAENLYQATKEMGGQYIFSLLEAHSLGYAGLEEDKSANEARATVYRQLCTRVVLARKGKEYFHNLVHSTISVYNRQLGNTAD